MQIITHIQPAPRRTRRQPPAHHATDFARVNARPGDRLIKWTTIIVSGLMLCAILGVAAIAGSVSHSAALAQAEAMRGM